ncbi:hypothetical protein ARALYDRAFT_331055 [Arabidopsis lyrata subsp. lyrata]|uniref:Embryo surrounding factor 1 brassicaceae domain-containing protein n=1 Tax=Arabidopsis lyrata subsp. lyrata TaxID=81972 RepID=D7MP66_ARALL|nr:putative defensin-like protein 254 [Arabidopsis lyrata subsp. lyrata]EFH39912.1 hypothetical protein ARALYDRAFT_331055 [Arabidopsis lyrata subsp. lyrata]|eukprot:XP_002863653.1 putative defensin-like protein 254 [Arabidopsis lyrata subsp. lyrata]
MNYISFKVLILASLLVVAFRQNLAVGDFCVTNEECRQNCQCDAAYCDISRNICVYRIHVMDTVGVSTLNQPCIPEHKRCGSRAPPPRRLKL